MVFFFTVLLNIIYHSGHKYENIDYKIPPHLPLPKRGNTPLFDKEGYGDIFDNDALFMHSLITALPVFQPPSVIPLTDDYGEQCESEPCYYIHYIVIAEIHRREKKRWDYGKVDPEKIPFVLVSEVENNHCYPGMAARKGVPLDPFKTVQQVMERFGNEESLEAGCLEMVKVKSRAERRHEDISKIREIETEKDHE